MANSGGTFLWQWVAGLCLTLLVAPLLQGQEEPDAAVTPAAPKAPVEALLGGPQAQELNATITFLKGTLTQVKTAEGQPWQPAVVGMELSAGALFRTGIRCMIQFTIPPDQTITIDRLGSVTLLEATQTGPNSVKTDIGVIRGKTLYEVDRQDVDHEVTLRCPVATHALRGTESGSLSYDSISGAFVTSVDTASTVINQNGQVVLMGGEGKAEEMGGDKNGPGEYYFSKATLDPSTPSSRTPIEQKLVAFFQSQGGPDFKRMGGGNLRRVRNATKFHKNLEGNLGGAIPFNVRLLVLNTPTSKSTDVDTALLDAAGYMVGTFPFDQHAATSTPNGWKAGPDTTGVTEFIANQKHNVPGSLQVFASWFRGPTTDVTVEVFKDKVSLGRQVGTVGQDNPLQTFDYDVPSDGADLGPNQAVNTLN